MNDVTKMVQTFTATIYVGFRVGPLNEPERKFYGLHDVEQICRAYCDEVGLCVTVTPTRYIYKGGAEDGAAVGLINYPRFPKEAREIKEHAIKLGERLRLGLEQYKVSIVDTNTTTMFGQDAH